METYFDKQKRDLYYKTEKIIDTYAMLKANHKGEKFEIDIPQDFKNEFFSLVDKVNLSLMEDKDNFYGYFLFQTSREIRFDISSPTAINFKGAKYVIYFNPIIFLDLNMRQMESTIKHEILHVISMHLVRARELKGKYSTLAINMAMDIVVNKYLNNLPPYAVTLENVNVKYNLKLEPYEPFEYYVEKIQTELDLQEVDKDGEEDDTRQSDDIETEYNPEKTHDIWEDSSNIDEETLKEFTQKAINNSQKGKIPEYLDGMISSLKNSKGELPWNLYLNRLMGTVESNKKKTITRRNRRQPNRLDLRGQLRSHKAEIAVALDISGSISDEEFKQAIKEVLNIVKNYNHEITIIECDNEIRRVYKVKSVKDIKERLKRRGSTKFSPVFEYANNKKINLLVYFTDGKGEDRLQVIPRGYKILWVISGRGDKLSLREPYGAVKKLSKVKIKDDTLDMSDVRNDGYSMNNQAPIL
ncbi:MULTISPECIES: VWA-like domain-containing protein [Romboutsia]|uniref:von Willebrand factor type A n=1 Tax=Romboutsia hominis TaxID=1507512 RepID=A0A2P2BS62_9FIRM|nr:MULTISPECIES: VWA-like domain-containing protein [Romboutsia]MCH1958512.1 VWA-like domain-containing protein [Romboutsia hominis]MCH1970428.1 VWA-like domain-containing protein [Romboutsia hominis]MDB8789112.1 VWA-like domain-containing protein [Romboutsia sp. 1001216sp1]MDB8802303.1 VWA-like domain-containing protein [Romboutsia sp. 1001216sp1]MDB8805244.1 VWA-like domain-containing protein [Romboutsia sp. 1001216sp1]